MKNYKYVIIGSGAAGIAAAEAISENSNESIYVFTDETKPYYYRPRLIDYIAGKADFNDFKYHDEKWFEERNIKVQYNQKLTEINHNENTVTINDEKINYEKLLITTGGTPFVPEPFRNLGGLTLRNFEDAENILEHCESSKIFCIIGGGLLGLETAGALSHKGKTVHVIETAEYPLPRQLDKEGGNFLENRLENLGITLHTNADIEKITENQLVLKSNSTINFDDLIICTGVRPATHFIDNTVFNTEKGALTVNNYLQTNIDNVYAAGDACSHNGVYYGTWMPAMEQGKYAGQNMAGNKTEYKGSNRSYSLKVVGVDLVSVGTIKAKTEEKIADKEEGIYKKAFIEDKTLRGFILYGDIKDEHNIITNLHKDFDKSKEYFSQKNKKSTGDDMYVCDICGYVYDPAKGDADRDIPGGTPFTDLPDDWTCPICGADKSKFKKNS